MSLLPTYVSSGFKRDLQREFPYLRLEWNHERERWALWEVDQRGWRWLDRFIETPEGEPREPGDWLITLLRASKLENQGVERGNVADRRAWIRKLYPDQDPWICDTCLFTIVDVYGYPGCNLVTVDDKHRRWCKGCLAKKGQPKDAHPMFENPKLVGLMRKQGALDEGRSGGLAERARRYAKHNLVFPAAHTTDFKGPLILN